MVTLGSLNYSFFEGMAWAFSLCWKNTEFKLYISLHLIETVLIIIPAFRKSLLSAKIMFISGYICSQNEEVNFFLIKLKVCFIQVLISYWVISVYFLIDDNNRHSIFRSIIFWDIISSSGIILLTEKKLGPLPNYIVFWFFSRYWGV